MSSLIAQPGQAAAAENPMDWVKIFLRGIGQVMFQENALTGLLFLLGIAAAAGEEIPRFAILMALGALIGTVLGTLSAWLAGYDRDQIRGDLWLQRNPRRHRHVLLLPADLHGDCAHDPRLRVSAMVTWAMRTYLPFPTYTFPFIVTTWVLLGVGTFLNLPRVELPPPPTTFNIVTAFTEGLGEVMFQASMVTSIAFLAGLAVSNWRHAVLALLGSILGTLVGLYHQDPTGPVTIGIYGYNAALAAIALYLWRPSLVIPVLGAFLTTPLTEMFPKIHDYIASLNPAALTAPFVFACWIVIAIGALEKYFCDKAT